MKDPFEYLAKDYFPWMKGLVSLDLSEKGYSQSEISAMIGVTQPSVNYYLKRERSLYLSKLQKLGLKSESIKEQEENYLHAVIEGGNEGALRIIQTAISALASGELCEYHKKYYHAPQDCDACMKLWGSGTQKERSVLLVELNRAVSALENSSTFPFLIPEINTNFVVSSKEAKTEKDVAGIEGRIAKIKGRARAMSGAEFGASKHLASVLLKVKKFYPMVNSAINVKFDALLEQLMQKSGWNIYYLESDSAKSDMIPDLIEEMFSTKGTKGKEPDAIVHRGSVGLEAATYIFGRSVNELLNKVLDLSALYYSRQKKNEDMLA